MHTALIISPHADDAAAFCGGLMARWAAEGWRVILVRVTDDAKDSVGVGSEAETIARNRAELETAAQFLGCHEVVNLDFPTDRLADVPLGNLRERMVYLFRKFRPYAVVSFDPFAPNEGNMDHIRVAQAVEEAYWVSAFDLHYPEHLDEGLKVFCVCERWYFARHPRDVNYYVDITAHSEAKVIALAAHKTMMRNILQQSRLQLETWGKRVALLDDAFAGDGAALQGLLEMVVQEKGLACAEDAGFERGRLAEAYRLVRFGDQEGLFQQLAENLPDAPLPPRRPGLDQ